MLGLAAASSRTRGEGWRETLFDGKPLLGQSHPANTQSIAHLTRIPRETVRRKLNLLQDKGWVQRDAQGNWLPTPEAASALAEGSHASVNDLRVILNAALRCEETAVLPTPKTK
ncbi:MAG: hypothetical protein MUF73_08570 [Rhodobacteraceae bacterium]|jgi:DNA-binding IclR family transcriptional regulator|nr:hypothetical protein [Paracoccaceae bacterium]